MVSEFQCPCRGTMRAKIQGKNMISRVLFYSGAAYDGYWTSEHMVKQLKDIIIISEDLHPGMMTVFLFDQSNNYKAFSENARIATNRMNMGPHEVEKSDVKVKDSYYYGRFGYHYERIP